MPFSPTSSETPIIEQSHADASKVDTPKPRGLLRRLYGWVLSWADSPHGMIALAGISFAESSFFPIPPDVLQSCSLCQQAEKELSFCEPYQLIASVLGAVAGLGNWLVDCGNSLILFFTVSFLVLRLKNSTMLNRFTKTMLFFG